MNRHEEKLMDILLDIEEGREVIPELRVLPGRQKSRQNRQTPGRLNRIRQHFAVMAAAAAVVVGIGLLVYSETKPTLQQEAPSEMLSALADKTEKAESGKEIGENTTGTSAVTVRPGTIDSLDPKSSNVVVQIMGEGNELEDENVMRNRHLVQLVDRCPQLEALTIDGSRWELDQRVTWFGDMGVGAEALLDDFSPLLRLNKLTRLRLLSLPSVLEHTCEVIAQIPTIEELTLMPFSAYVEGQDLILKHLDRLVELPNLRRLDLMMAVGDAELAVVACMPGHPVFTYAGLAADISDEGLRDLVRVRNSNESRDDDITALDLNGDTVHYQGKPRYTTQGIKLLASLDTLTSLDFSANQGMCDEWLRELSTSRSLVKLVLDRCPTGSQGITLEGLRALGACSSLRILSIIGCEGFDVAAAIELSLEMKHCEIHFRKGVYYADGKGYLSGISAHCERTFAEDLKLPHAVVGTGDAEGYSIGYLSDVTELAALTRPTRKMTSDSAGAIFFALEGLVNVDWEHQVVFWCIARPGSVEMSGGGIVVLEAGVGDMMLSEWCTTEKDNGKAHVTYADTIRCAVFFVTVPRMHSLTVSVAQYPGAPGSFISGKLPRVTVGTLHMRE